ncbi:MAG TPA: hypothetical protein VMP68_19655 [Candidatus Eisenbacteria bacterium]|nr:hypothetical protein [Candidatus Eisenbacteria bacterium]
MEYFDESWKKRIQEMAGFIEPGESVVDLGCGMMWLKPMLRDNLYYPVDYKTRDEATVIADFNRREYPDIRADVAFLSGALEYVQDFEWFVEQVCSHSQRCILSYCTTECYPDLDRRRQKAWKNHLSRGVLVSLFARNGMRLDCESTAVLGNPIFVFSRQRTAIGTAKDVGLEAGGTHFACSLR